MFAASGPLPGQESCPLAFVAKGSTFKDIRLRYCVDSEFKLPLLQGQNTQEWRRRSHHAVAEVKEAPGQMNSEYCVPLRRAQPNFALVHGKRVLCARRSSNRAMTGRWKWMTGEMLRRDCEMAVKPSIKNGLTPRMPEWIHPRWNQANRNWESSLLNLSVDSQRNQR